MVLREITQIINHYYVISLANLKFVNNNEIKVLRQQIKQISVSLTTQTATHVALPWVIHMGLVAPAGGYLWVTLDDIA